MINSDMSIPCPLCNNKIPFDTHQLLLGVQFVCSNCQSAIGLAAESKEVVRETMQKLEVAKSQVLK